MINIDILASYQTFQIELDQCFNGDKSRLKKLWHQIQNRQKRGQPSDRLQVQLIDLLAASKDRLERRRLSRPDVSFPAELPIAKQVDEIAELIEKNQVLVIAGETGSGKTTQIPKICLRLGRGVIGMIGHTQPRRLAARTVASRIADELGEKLGESVGYQVRFTDRVSEQSHIKLMTDGILLAEIQNDPLLQAYDTLVIDEAHERSLNIDFLIGCLKQILPKRPDLKLIVTSATIDVERFSKHFDDAPVVQVSGRTYPVEIRYRPLLENNETQVEAVIAAINELISSSKGSGGDILVFLSGEREIRETALAIRKASIPHLDILPLYARLSLAEQNKVFSAHRGRRVVLATNVAETSITVPGIRFVIDPGTARISRYSLRNKVQRLPIERISQASANQRAGRCGRVAAGICIRLYEEDDFLQRREFTDPEILRTSLAAVLLQMLHLRVGDIRAFPFIDRPENKSINDGFKLLHSLQAITGDNKLAPLGKQLVKLPIDPSLGRIIIAANKFNCLTEILIIVTALAIQDPRDRPHEKRQQADEKHRRFNDEKSDMLTLVNLWNYLEEQRQTLSQNQLRQLCQREFLSYLRFREWRELHHQLRLAIKNLGYKENVECASYDSIHQALLTGMVENVGKKNEEKSEKDYLGTRNRRFLLFPGSAIAKKSPKWVISASFIETSRLFSHYNAQIEPQWVMDAAQHLVKHHYYEPHYQAKTGNVLAFDRITLFGLVLVEKERVHYQTINPAIARGVFIRSALVEGAYVESGKRVQGEFFKHNQEQIKAVASMEDKIRRRDILVDDEVIFQFYNGRIPEHVTNLAGFEHWRKNAEKANPALLLMDRGYLMLRLDAGAQEAQFPNDLKVGHYQFPLSYRFDPGHEDDGVSVGIPATHLHEVDEARLSWLVPGMLYEKCVALVKALPKILRKKFVPVPQFIDQIFPRLQACNEPLNYVLKNELERVAQVVLPKDVWHDAELDDYYVMNIHVLDEEGAIIDRGRNLQLLRQRNKQLVKKSIAKVGLEIEQKDITRWQFGNLPDSCVVRQGKVSLKGFPALVDERASVAIKVIDDEQEAHRSSVRGCARLIMLRETDMMRYLRKELLRENQVGLALVNWGNRQDVLDEILLKAIYESCLLDKEIPRNAEAFDDLLRDGRNEIIDRAFYYEKLIQSILLHLLTIKKAMKASKSALALTFTFADITQQIEQLLFRGFLFDTPRYWLEQFPRYLRAIEIRLEKAPASPVKDKQGLEEIASLWKLHQDRLAEHGEARYSQDSNWIEFRWLIEELRVSFFAQSLKTIKPVSTKRLNKHWQNLSDSDR